MNGFNAEVKARIGQMNREMVRGARRSRFTSLAVMIPITALTIALAAVAVVFLLVTRGATFTLGVNIGLLAMLVANLATTIQFVQSQTRIIALYEREHPGHIVALVKGRP